jgi:hypothetical protein
LKEDFEEKIQHDVGRMLGARGVSRCACGGGFRHSTQPDETRAKEETMIRAGICVSGIRRGRDWGV